MDVPAPFPPAPARARRRALVARLSTWFEANARDLPWRRTRDPYGIWISEAMLQQTRVETVVDYWRRFMARFPDAGALARADLDDVLEQWSGLGYYRRARSLHAAAQKLIEAGSGTFPRTREEILELPGVGPYTAGAVLSIAFDLPEPLVDGNVERVFARLFELAVPPDSPAFRRHVWALAGLFVADSDSPRVWNQALMELGATICTPRVPRCDACPLARSCRAKRAKRQEELPLKKLKRASVPVELEILVVARGSDWLVRRRPPGGRMAGLFEFPTREVGVEGAPPTGLFPESWPVGAEGAIWLEPQQHASPLAELRHAITHHRIRGRVLAGRMTGGSGLPEGFAWLSGGDPGDSRRRPAITGMTRKVLERLARLDRSAALE